MSNREFEVLDIYESDIGIYVKIKALASGKVTQLNFNKPVEEDAIERACGNWAETTVIVQPAIAGFTKVKKGAKLGA